MPRKTAVAVFVLGDEDRRASMRPRPDAAENAATWRARGRRPASRFNEAAARCRGKRGEAALAAAPSEASMRPRPDAAENDDDDGDGDTLQAASMRPRPDAAENPGGRRAARGHP